MTKENFTIEKNIEGLPTAFVAYKNFGEGPSIGICAEYDALPGMDETDFINCVAFGKVAELMKKYLQKGDRIAVEGKIQVGKYATKEGEKRNIVDVIVENIQFLREKKETKVTDEEEDFPFN